MFNSLSRTLLVASAVLIPSITADFHLMQTSRYYPQPKFFTCPSNYFNDKCWCGGNRRSSNTSAFYEKASNGEYKVRLENVCGVAALDLWYRPNGVEGDDRVRWEAYFPNASGHVEVTCYDQGQKNVGECYIGLPVQHKVHDGYVCYSSICGYA